MILLVLLFACNDNEPPTQNVTTTEKKQEEDYIRRIPGKDETIPEQIKQKGQVLIAYSDCYTCHSVDVRSKGPSFRDIARRYPANEAYSELLAHKVILGGSGAWGYPVMTPHPDLPLEDAKTMVKFILSLEN